MQKITSPTRLPPVVIARLLERQGSPLAPLAEEIYGLAIAYRIDAAFALAHCMVESRLGCKHEAQINRNAALVRAALTRLTRPAGPLRPAETVPMLPPRYGDDFGSGYVTYPGWLTGIEEYFRLLRLVFVDGRHEEKVEQIARAFLATAPGRRRAPSAELRAQNASQPPALQHLPPVAPQEVAAYARRIERQRAMLQTP
jgi:hypothetical protein